MKHSKLKSALHSIVLEHGYERVHHQLHEIGIAEFSDTESEKLHSGDGTSPSKVRRKSKPTAPQYVAKMGLPPDKEKSVSKLAERFQQKSFLPRFGDVVNFCHFYNVEVPASKSRVNAIPRVFRCIAAMENNDILRIVDEDMFSGPSRLGPIADAIRRNGRASSGASTTRSLGHDT